MKKDVNKLMLMAGNRFILDTNIIVAWLNGDEDIAVKIDKADSVSIPSIVAGELFYGAFNSTHVQKNLVKIQSLLTNYNLVKCDVETALAYGRIKFELKKAGKPIPENDIWIAALVLQHNLTLVTRDAHFKQVKQIKTKKW